MASGELLKESARRMIASFPYSFSNRQSQIALPHSPAAMFLRGSASLCWIVRFGNSEIPQCGVAVNSLMTPAKANNPLCSPHGGDADGAGERQSRQLLAAGEFAHPHPGGRRNLLPRDA